MRISAVAAAMLGIAVAFPIAAATLSDATKETAGILPDSPLSFIDRSLDALAIMTSFSAESKLETTLEVAEERAAESTVMASEGNVELATSSATAASTDLSSAVEIASSADAELQAGMVAKIETASTTIQATLQESFTLAPAEVQAEVQTAIEPIIGIIAEAPKAVVSTNTDANLACNASAFDSCVRAGGCTEDTSETCFKACPPITVTCENPQAGKTCRVPDTACVNSCLSKIAGCFDACLASSHCKKEEVNTSSLKLVSPEEVQRAFQLQLQAEAAAQ